MKMSKTPIRAALTRLEEDGLVTVSPQQGIVVRELTLPEVTDHFEIRLALESYIARTLAGRLTAAQATRMEDNLAVEQAAVDRHDVPGIIRADTQFHLLFCEFLGNQEILKTMNRLRDKVERVIRRVVTQDPVRSRAAHAEHRAIADAVLAGDGPLAAQRMVEHLEFGQQILLSPRRVQAAPAV
jgi:DNA-binding GntR family transcriptional regulator